jgi:malate synthase
MTARTAVHRLQVATELHQFIETRVLPGSGINNAAFWKGFDAIVADLAPKNIALLAERDRLQSELDGWHQAHPGPITDMAAYRSFLEQIGYLVPAPKKVTITTRKVDDELAIQAGPQLVVPVLNARYALNAANARWGSLYDALYGTDAISEADGCEKGSGYNPKRGAKVIDYARHVLDRTAPLRKGSHVDAVGYRIQDGKLVVKLKDGGRTSLANAAQLVGYQGEASTPSSVLLVHNGLHLDIRIDRSTPIGAKDPAGVCDLVVESALSTILDLEDSVAVVDAQDKVLAYSNWLGILQGTLTEEVSKGGKTFTRGLNGDRLYTAPNGKGQVRLHGRSLMFVRNVGHLMTNPAILYTDPQGQTREIPEGIMDAVITTTIALHDLKRTQKDAIRNSRKGSVYIVKPKMHGPAEVAFADQHGQAGHHGRRAPHQRQPQGLHCSSQEPRGLHQHRFPGPHRRRDAYRHASGPDAAQGRHEVQRMDPGLRAQQRAGGPVVWPARQGANRQGHVGHARPDEGHARAEDRSPQGRRQHRLGAQPDRCDLARHALPPGAGQRCAKGSGENRR